MAGTVVCAASLVGNISDVHLSSHGVDMPRGEPVEEAVNDLMVMARVGHWKS